MKRLFAVSLAYLLASGCSHLHRAPSKQATIAPVEEAPKVERPDPATPGATPLTRPASFVAHPPLDRQSPTRPPEKPSELADLPFGPIEAKPNPAPASVPAAEPIELAAASTSAAPTVTDPPALRTEAASIPDTLTAMPTIPEVVEPKVAESIAAPVEPATLPDSMPATEPANAPSPAPIVPAPDPKPLAIEAQGPVEAPPQPKGRAVAKVGNEVITLPEFTEAVKHRLGLLPTGTTPSRKLIIKVARSTLEFLIERSLIMQEARRQFPERTRLEAALAEADDRWLVDELPRLLRREGAANEAELRTKLARRAQSLDDLREISRLRVLATSMMAGAGVSGNLEGYLGQLRVRTPITSIMTPAQISASQGDPSSKVGISGGRGE